MRVWRTAVSKIDITRMLMDVRRSRKGSGCGGRVFSLDSPRRDALSWSADARCTRGELPVPRAARRP
eukprot:scaffold75041_cov31-Tisochrysis_lutea.AAC.1